MKLTEAKKEECYIKQRNSESLISYIETILTAQVEQAERKLWEKMRKECRMYCESLNEIGMCSEHTTRSISKCDFTICTLRRNNKIILIDNGGSMPKPNKTTGEKP